MRPSINDLMKRAAAGSYDEKFKKKCQIIYLTNIHKEKVLILI